MNLRFKVQEIWEVLRVTGCVCVCVILFIGVKG